MTDAEVKNRLIELNQKLVSLNGLADQVSIEVARIKNQPHPVTSPSGPVLPSGAPVDIIIAEIDRKIIAISTSLQNSLAILVTLP